MQLLDFNRENTSKWIAAALDSLPKQNNAGLVTATPAQLNDIHVGLIRYNITFLLISNLLKIILITAIISRSNTSKSVTHALKELIRLYR